MDNQFEKIKKFIKNNLEPSLLGFPATNEDIEYIETKLQIKLPNQYLIFLKEWGSVALSYYEYYGTHLLFRSADFNEKKSSHFVDHRQMSPNEIPKSILLYYENLDSQYANNPKVVVADRNDPILLYRGIDDTIWCRKKGLPHTFITIAFDEGDEYLCLDCTKEEPEVMIYDPFSNYFRTTLAPTLFDAMYDDIDKSLVPTLRAEGKSVEW